MKKMSMAIVYAIVSLVMLGGGYLLFKGLFNIQRSIASRKWPNTAC